MFEQKITLILLFSGFFISFGDRIKKRDISVDTRFKVNGATVQPNDVQKYMYQVFLMNKCSFFCGGTIITERLVLTAAHCVYFKKPKDLTIKTGVTKLNGSGQIVDVFSFILHGSYDPNALRHDIALLILQQKLDMTSLIAAKLPQPNEVFVNQLAEVSGWGGQSNDLAYAMMRIIHDKYCQEEKFISRICVEPALSGTGIIPGDSGGPLVLRHSDYDVTLVGAVSGHVGISGQVFANISYLRPWIDRAIAEANHVIRILDTSLPNLPKHQCT